MHTEVLLNKLSTFGYDQKGLEKGRKILEEAEQLYANKELKYGEQYAASENLKIIWEKADTAYKIAHKIAKIVFKDVVEANAALQLPGRRKKTYTGWMD
jgi:hypothetical protein